MKSFSEDGKFIIAMPMYADENGRKTVTMTAREGKKINLCDVADAIRADIFGINGYEEDKEVKLYCHVIVGKKEYDFRAEWWPKPSDYLSQLAEQIEL